MNHTPQPSQSIRSERQPHWDVAISRRALLKGAACLAGAAALESMLTGCGSTPEADCEQRPDSRTVSMLAEPIGQDVNIIKHGTWRLAGAQATQEGLIVHPTRQTTEHRESGVYQPDYPINLFGTHLRIPQQCTLETTIEHAEGAAFHCYARPPLVRDDARIDYGSIRMMFEDNTLRVQSWNGDKQPDIDQRFPLGDTRERRRLTLGRDAARLMFAVDGRVVGELNNRNIFNDNRLWFGFDAQHQEAVVQRLYAKGSGEVIAVDASTLMVQQMPGGMQARARQKNSNLLIGAAVAPGPMVADKTYSALLFGGEYGLITPENELKPVHIMPHEGITTFENADGIIELAHRHGLEVHGHTLVFERSLPAWMRRLPTDTAAEKARVREVMEQYITTVVGHFKGRIKSWDVINEPLADFKGGRPQWREHLWYRAMGPQYVEIALRAARAADPQVLLFVNENAIENDEDNSKKMRWDFLLREVAVPMRQRGLLDGVGMQGHVYQLPRDSIRASTVKTHLQQLSQYELLGRISEIDVTTNNAKNQAEQYSNALRPCTAAPNCDGFITWGVMMGYGNNGMPWDRDGCAAPAISAMKQVLSD